MLTQTLDGRTLPVVPARELRLLVDGIRSWVQGITSRPAGASCLGILEGAPGRGQGLLVRALHALCSQLRVRVLGGSFSAARGEPGGAFLDAVEQLGELAREGGTDAAVLEEALRRHGADLRRLVPDADWPGDLSERPDLAEPYGRLRLVDSLAQLLLEASVRTPTVLVLEDVHGADPFSLDLLSHLLRVMGRVGRRLRPRLLVLVTRSDGSAAPDVSGADGVGVAFRIQARGYGRDELVELGRRRGVEVPLSRRETALRTSGGSVRHLHWWVEARRQDPAGRDVPDSASFDELVRFAYRELEPEPRSLVLALALLGGSVPLGFLGEWAGSLVAGEMSAEARPEEAADEPEDAAQGAESIAGLLEDLEGRGWVRVTRYHGIDVRQRVWLRDDVRSVVLDEEGGERLFRLLRPLALRVREEPARQKPEPPDPERGRRSALRRWRVFAGVQRLARSLSSGRLALGADASAGEAVEGVPEETALEAAGYLEAIGCPDEAVRLVEEALRWGGREGDPGARRLLLRRAELLARAGHWAEAEEARAEILRAFDDATGVERATWWREIAEIRAECGEADEAAESLARAEAALVGSQDPGQQALSFAARARLELRRGDVAAAADSCRRGLDGLPGDEEDAGEGGLPDDVEGASGVQDARRELFAVAARVSVRQGDWKGALRLEEAVEQMAREAGDSAEVVASLRRRSRIARRHTEYRSASSCLEAALAEAERSGSRLLRVEVLGELGQVGAEQKRFGEAHRLLVQSRAGYRAFGRDGGPRELEALLLELELRLGRFRTAVRTLDRVLDQTFGPRERPEDEDADELDRTARRLADERRGDVRRLRQLERRLSRRGDRVGPEDRIELARLHRAAGHIGVARRLLVETVRQESVRTRPDLRVEAQRLEARWAVLAGDFEGAMGGCRRLLRTLARDPDPAGVAAAHLDIAELLAERGQLGIALDHTLRGLRPLLDLADAAEAARALLQVAELLADAAQTRAADGFASRAVWLARSVGSVATELRGLRVLARGTGAGAERALARADALGKLLDDPVESCRLWLVRGWQRLRRGDPGGAIESARRGIERAREMGLRALLDDFLQLVGSAESHPAHSGKNYLRALEVLEQALDGAQRMGRPRSRWRTLEAMGDLWEARGQRDLAVEYRQRAEVLAAGAMARLPAELRGLAWRRS